MRTTGRQCTRAIQGTLTALAATAALAGSAWAAPAAPYFTALPASGGTQMTQARSYATATTLPSGKVLIAGGYNGGFLSTTETFNPAVPTFAGLPVPVSIERAYAIAAPLPGDKVLLTGGYPTYQQQTAELFDAATNTTTPLPAQPTASRAGAVAAPLPGWKVLIAGGTPNFPPVGAVRSAELFDPATNTFSALPASGNTQLTVARRGAVAAPLPDGKVLIAGGTESLDTPPILRSAELFDPATNTFTALPASGDTQMTTARITAIGVALPDGKVLIAGGNDGTTTLQTAELFDPVTQTFTALPATGTTQLGTARRNAAAALLQDGTVLIAGGENTGGYLRTAELFVPAPSGNVTGGAFGDQVVGQASAVQSITFKNLGAQPLDIDAGALSVSSDSGAAGDFTLVSESCHGKQLAFRETCTLEVRFTPAAIGARTARITLSDNEPGGAATIPLTGTGIPVPPATTGATGTPAAAATTTPAGTSTTATPVRKKQPKATCSARRSRKTGRTRITCTVTGLAARSARARLSSKGTTIVSGRMTAAGRITITTTRRVRPGSYSLTVGATKLTVRVR